MATANAQQFVVIERIAPGGDGLGRCSSGERVFVSGTAPGDEVELERIEHRRGVAHGTVARIVSPGPERVVPACPFAERCGGCDFIHLSARGQQSAKLGILEDALARIGELPMSSTRVKYVSFEDGFGYRSRVRLHVGPNGEVGFLSPRSKDVIGVEHCLVAEPRINDELCRLSKLEGKAARLLQLCSELELRTAEHVPHLLVRLFPKPGISLHLPSFLPLFSPGTALVLAASSEDDSLTQRYDLPGRLTTFVPASAFTQVNRTINARLVSDVVEAATLRNLRTFVDPYAGAGNFTLPLLAAGLSGEASDVTSAAVVAARRAARELGLPFTGFNVGSAEVQLQSLVRSGQSFELVLLDPPRSGCKEILPLVRQLGAQLIALVACDPVSLARDLKPLVSWGAHVESLTVYDMFPQTHHVETLALVAM